MSEAITRRRAIGAGTLAAVVVPALPAFAAPELPLIDQGEALVQLRRSPSVVPSLTGPPPLEGKRSRQLPTDLDHRVLVLQLEDLLIRMADRDRNNLCQLLDLMGRAAGLREELFAGGLGEMHAYMGPGNRVTDQIDREETLEEQERAATEAAAAVAAAALAAGPPVVIEQDEPDTTLRAMVLVLDGRPHVSINMYLIDRASAEQWARQQLALGKRFAVWTVKDI